MTETDATSRGDEPAILIRFWSLRSCCSRPRWTGSSPSTNSGLRGSRRWSPWQRRLRVKRPAPGGRWDTTSGRDDSTQSRAKSYPNTVGGCPRTRQPSAPSRDWARTQWVRCRALRSGSGCPSSTRTSPGSSFEFLSATESQRATQRNGTSGHFHRSSCRGFACSTSTRR